MDPGQRAAGPGRIASAQAGREISELLPGKLLRILQSLIFTAPFSRQPA